MGRHRAVTNVSTSGKDVVKEQSGAQSWDAELSQVKSLSVVFGGYRVIFGVVRH
ncbi:hypothetical protein SAMN05660657_05368 [Geodermatophilus amargosae]|uniref:Uncharacterized protein n=1 Tax=Geodermatophilus amargosae TaxID=1296565 RepID=A0A1I7D6E2_9ACTN|nr:hypothetical protein SAMN05660657_05368 [Geodermatophilus amargosae]